MTVMRGRWAAAQGDPAKEEMTVPVASGELRLVLSWAVESEA